MLICALKDEQGGHTHAAGIELRLSLIYDCMEEYALVLNIHDLSSCWGDGHKFKEYLSVAELKLKLKKNRRRENLVVHDGEERVFIPVQEIYYRSFQLIHILNSPSRCILILIDSHQMDNK